MSDIEQTRSQILQESDLIGNRRRFGLFSQPISTAVGDDGAFRSKIHQRNEMGKPITEPRNVYVSPNKSGHLRKSYFGPLNPLATHTKHDIFIEEGIRLLKEETQSFNTNRKQTNFIPPKGINKSLATPAYPYIDQKNPELDPKRFREEDGRVRSGLRNFYSNNSQKVNQTVFKHYKYLDDPYEREHDQELQRLKKERSKEKEDSFKPNSFSPTLLTRDSKVYGSDVQFSKKKSMIYETNGLKHENPWKPNSYDKEGREGMFKSVHEYRQNPPPERKLSRVLQKDKESFKGMNASMLSVPTPSIALSKVNMMKSINRSLSPRR